MNIIYVYFNNIIFFSTKKNYYLLVQYFPILSQHYHILSVNIDSDLKSHKGLIKVQRIHQYQFNFQFKKDYLFTR